MVLSAPSQPDARDRITARLVSRTLRTLKTEFDYVVIDTAPSFDEQTLQALDETDECIIVTILDVPTLKNVKVALETLDLLTIAVDHRHLVVNRADDEVGLDYARVEAILGVPISVPIPSSMDVASATNAGKPIVLANPDHPASRAFRQLASHVTGDLTMAPSPVGQRDQEARQRPTRPPPEENPEGMTVGSLRERLLAATKTAEAQSAGVIDRRPADDRVGSPASCVPAGCRRTPRPRRTQAGGDRVNAGSPDGDDLRAGRRRGRTAQGLRGHPERPHRGAQGQHPRRAAQAARPPALRHPGRPGGAHQEGPRGPQGRPRRPGTAVVRGRPGPGHAGDHRRHPRQRADRALPPRRGRHRDHGQRVRQHLPGEERPARQGRRPVQRRATSAPHDRQDRRAHRPPRRRVQPHGATPGSPTAAGSTPSCRRSPSTGPH